MSGMNYPLNFGQMKLSIPRSPEEVAEEKRRVDEYNAKVLAEQGFNPDGSPYRPTRESLLDPSTGLLKKAYQYQGQTIDPTKLEGYSAYKTDALRTGPSAWAALAKQKQQTEQSQAFDQANQDVMAGNAQARSGLAMRGGLSAGARERLAGQMQKDLATGRQKVAGQGILARANIDLQDEQNRQSMLNNFMNQEGQLARYNTDVGNKGQEFNILQALGENARGDEFKMKMYEEQMRKWAANRTAEATERSGGGGGGGK